VGKRLEDGTDLTFAFKTLRRAGANLGTLTAAENGPDLLLRARPRARLQQDIEPMLGDLVVFHRVKGAKPASLIGIVVSADNQGTAEFIYLARGIVRRGYVNPARPSDKRDNAGRVLNTHVRHLARGDGRRAKYLAGELFAGYLPLDRLAR